MSSQARFKSQKSKKYGSLPKRGAKVRKRKGECDNMPMRQCDNLLKVVISKGINMVLYLRYNFLKNYK